MFSWKTNALIMMAAAIRKAWSPYSCLRCLTISYFVSSLVSTACRSITPAVVMQSSRIETASSTASSGTEACTTKVARSRSEPLTNPRSGKRVVVGGCPRKRAYSNAMPPASRESTSSSPPQFRRAIGDFSAMTASIRLDVVATDDSSCSPNRARASASTWAAGTYSFSITTGRPSC